MKHRKYSWNSNKASCLGMVLKQTGKIRYRPIKNQKLWILKNVYCNGVTEN